MNQQLFINGQAKFPVSTEALDFIQQQILLTARLASIAGTNVIITPATTTADGLVVINGELLPLLAGTAKQYIQIVETKQSIVAGTQTFTDVRIIRYAQYANSGTPVSQFTTLDTIVRLMQRISNIEGTYMTETAIRTLVSAVQNNLNTTNSNLTTTNSNLSTTNSNLSALTTRVQTIENNYKTAAQITELLNANAQHHLPKGSIIDWYGTADCDHIPYGFVPCGAFFRTSAQNMTTTIQAEQNKWKARYGTNNISMQLKQGVGSTMLAILITSCNGQTVPDLTDLFVVQAGGNYSLGDTGGRNTVQLQIDEIPKHRHIYSTDERPQTDTTYKGMGKVENQQLGSSGTGEGARLYTSYAGGQYGEDGNRKSNDYLGTSYHENRPPFYALYKLIKVI